MLTQAIMIGMTPKQFWHDEPSLFFNYLDAYERKNKEKYEAEINKMNVYAWLQGIYTCAALRANPVMGRGKKYPDKPIELNKPQPESLSEEQEMDMRTKTAMVQMMEFEKYAKLYNKVYFGKEEGK